MHCYWGPLGQDDITCLYESTNKCWCSGGAAQYPTLAATLCGFWLAVHHITRSHYLLAWGERRASQPNIPATWGLPQQTFYFSCTFEIPPHLYKVLLLLRTKEVYTSIVGSASWVRRWSLNQSQNEIYEMPCASFHQRFSSWLVCWFRSSYRQGNSTTVMPSAGLVWSW